MKKAFLLILCLFALAVSPAIAGGDGWYDMEGCGMCSNFLAQPGLMENMDWEHHVINEGMMSVTLFNTPESEVAYDLARAEMEKTGAKMHAGEKVHLCDFCTSMMGVMMAGASIEEIEINGGRVMLLTSDDPELVEQIQAHAERSIEELAKMEAAMGS